MNKGKNIKTSKSMLGNNNAENYSEKDAAKLFNDSIKKSLETTENGKVYKYDFIGEVARDLHTYHHIYAHLIKRFPELNCLFTELKCNLEANCYFNSKKGNIKEATAIVNLKSNHKWVDRQQIEQNISGDVNINPKRWV